MAKKRAKVDLDFTNKTDLFSPTEEPAKPKKTVPPKDLRARATYTIGRELKERIRAESVRLGVPASQVVKYLLLAAFADYESGRIPSPDLIPSNSPAYRNVIDFSE